MTDLKTNTNELQEVLNITKSSIVDTSALTTEDKTIVGAINEVHNKTRIRSIDACASDPYNTSIDPHFGVSWESDFEFYEREQYDGNTLSAGPMYHYIPIVPGENVTFDIDEQSQTVMINAKGGNYISKYTVGVTGSEKITDIINKLTETYPDFQLGVWSLIEFVGASSGLYGLTIEHYGDNTYNIGGIDFSTFYTMSNNVRDWSTASVWGFPGYFQPPIPYYDETNEGQVLKIVDGVPTWTTP